ncbi:hypothetical protein CCMA1212_000033 [Trichoderma ghanense]|uniref:Uncharacterized protein n=1 Tax=Trichoderma ghanense TaxID=65468 RepID=A0ABY2HGS2_9HYPO
MPLMPARSPIDSPAADDRHDASRILNGRVDKCRYEQGPGEGGIVSGAGSSLPSARTTFCEDGTHPYDTVEDLVRHSPGLALSRKRCMSCQGQGGHVVLVKALNIAYCTGTSSSGFVLVSPISSGRASWHWMVFSVAHWQLTAAPEAERQTYYIQAACWQEFGCNAIAKPLRGFTLSMSLLATSPQPWALSRLSSLSLSPPLHCSHLVPRHSSACRIANLTAELHPRTANLRPATLPERRQSSQTLAAANRELRRPPRPRFQAPEQTTRAGVGASASTLDR